ncbi:MAG TPA: DUF1801 domain-containing protein [Candidatus Paceibacterota bacterium]
MKTTAAATIKEYIAEFPKDVQKVLNQVYKTVKQNAPQAEESIAYGMPAFKLNGKPLVYFAAFKEHIGFYPTPNGVTAFKKDFAKYKQGKGSVQFPLSEPMPIQLIEKIVKFRVEENLKNVKKK